MTNKATKKTRTLKSVRAAAFGELLIALRCIFAGVARAGSGIGVAAFGLTGVVRALVKEFVDAAAVFRPATIATSTACDRRHEQK